MATEKEPIPLNINNLKTKQDFAKDTGLGIKAAGVAIARTIKKNPTIKVNLFPSETGGNRMLSFTEEAYQELLDAYNQRKNKKRERSKPQEFLTLNDGDKIPLLSGDKREEVSKLLAEARNKQQPFSKQRLRETLYPDDNSKIADPKVRFLIYRINKELNPHGWRVEHPIYIDRKGKERRIRGFYEVLRERESIVKPRKQKPSSDEAPSVLGGRLEVTKPEITENKTEILPTSQTIWESPQAIQERLQEEIPIEPWPASKTNQDKENEKLDKIREEFNMNLSIAILSHIATGNTEKLTRNLKGLYINNLPTKISLDLLIGGNSENPIELQNYLERSFPQTLESFWHKPKSYFPKERKIIEYCKMLGAQAEDQTVSDANRQQVIDITLEHFSIPTQGDKKLSA